MPDRYIRLRYTLMYLMSRAAKTLSDNHLGHPVDDEEVKRLIEMRQKRYRVRVGCLYSTLCRRLYRVETRERTKE